MLENSEHLSAHVCTRFVFISHGRDQHRLATALRRRVCPDKFVSSIQNSCACVAWYPRVSIWGQIQSLYKLHNPSFNWHNNVCGCSLLLVAWPLRQRTLYLCIWFSLGTTPERCQGKRRKNKSSLLGRQGLIRRKGGTISPQGERLYFSRSLFRFLFTPVPYMSYMTYLSYMICNQL